MNFEITKSNIGNTDRMIRVGVAALLIVGALRGGSWTSAIIAAALLATAYFRFCPAYGVFDFSTDKPAVPEVK